MEKSFPVILSELRKEQALPAQFLGSLPASASRSMMR